MFDRGRAARIDHHNLRSTFPGFHQSLRDFGSLARFEHIRPPQDDHLRVLQGGGVETRDRPIRTQQVRQNNVRGSIAVIIRQPGAAAKQIQETP